MNRDLEVKTILKSLPDWLLVVFVIMFSGSYIRGLGSSGFATLMIFAGIFTAIALPTINKNNNLKGLCMLAYCVVVLLINMIMNLENINLLGYLSYFIIPYIAFILSELIEFDRFKSIFIKIMLFMCIYSLVSYTIFIENPDVLIGIEHAGGYIKYRSSIFHVILMFNGVGLERNCGIFWEPGIFSTFIIIACLFVSLTPKLKNKFLYYILFAVTIFTTKSTAGYMIFICVILFIFVNKLQKGSKVYSWLCFSLPILLLLALICIIKLDDIIFALNLQHDPTISKLLSENLYNSSRFIAIQSNLEIFFENPIFGVGLKQIGMLLKDLDSYDTATSFTMLSKFGIWGLAYTMMFVVGIFKFNGCNFLARMILLIIAMFIVNKEPHDAFLFTWLIMFFFLKTEKSKYKSSLENENAVLI